MSIIYQNDDGWNRIPGKVPQSGRRRSSGMVTIKSPCCCGPEIKTYLERLLADVRTAFFSWDAKKQATQGASLTNFMTAGGAWDILQLHTPQNSPTPVLFDTAMRARLQRLGGKSFFDYGCGKALCWRTVSVGGQCFSASIVNYTLFGAMFRLCNDYYPLQYADYLEGYAKEAAVVYPEEYPKLFLDEYFTIGSAKSKIAAWQEGWGGRTYRAIYNRGGGSYSPKRTRQKQQWAQIGWEGAYGAITPPSKGTHNCKPCLHPPAMYQFAAFFPLAANWNGIEIP